MLTREQAIRVALETVDVPDPLWTERPSCAIVEDATIERPQECDALQANLSAALPDHSVFLSGGSSTYLQVTVMPVVSRQLILGSKSAIAAAVRLYRAECERLTALRQAGQLPACWAEDEHGGHCRFENQETGQVVEAPLNPGVHEVDPYFFAGFVSSTPQCSAVARLLTHPYHDAARMLDVLTDSGPS